MALSTTAKNSLKFGGAALAAAAAGYLLYDNQKEKDYKGISIIAAAAGALAFLIINSIINVVDEITSKPDKVALEQDTDENGNVIKQPSIDVKPLTDSLYQDIYEILGFRNPDPYQRLAALSNTDFIAVYNDWTERYWEKDKETLRQAITGELFIGTLVGTVNVIKKRFDELNLQ